MKGAFHSMKGLAVLILAVVLAPLSGCTTATGSPTGTSVTDQQRSRPDGPLTLGRTIAYVSDEPGNYDIFVLTGSNEPVRLTETEEDESLPTWSPDGSKIAFGRRESDNTIDLWVMNADGGEQRRVYDSGSVYLDGISWHPNGRLVYFSRGYFDGPGNMSQKIVMVSVGSTETQDAPGVDGLWDRHFTYSHPVLTAEGGQIAFAHYEGYAMPFRRDIYVGDLSADGMSASHIVRLTEEQGGDWTPSWSPDGSAIAWTHETGVNSGDHDIWVMNADGSGKRQVSTEPGQEVDPVWSADGQAIIYAGDAGGSYQLYMRHAWGDGELLQLTHGGANHVNPDRKP